MSNRPSHKAKYFDLFDRINAPCLLINSDQKVIDANVKAENFFDLELSKFNEFDISVFWATPEEAAKEIRMAFRRYHPRVSNKTVEINGITKHLLIETCPLELGENGEEKVVQILIKDQTELVETQKALELKNLELAQANELLAKLSITDKLTNLYNRRYFDEALQKELERALRSGHSLALLIFDVDKFKNYNDTNGHMAGDELLTELAAVIKDSIRGIDIACRYGGEEFVVLCPETNISQSLIVAERIRINVEKYPFKHREKQPLGCVSVSIGVSAIPENTTSGPELKTQADEALYHSKETGRNRTTVYQKIAKVA